MTKLNLIGPKDAPEDDNRTYNLPVDPMYTWDCQLCELTYDDNTDALRTLDGFVCCPRCMELESKGNR